MQVTHRNWALAGASGFGIAGLFHKTAAVVEPAAEAAVAEAVEALRKALLDRDKASWNS
jgi:hypothetical protein